MGFVVKATWTANAGNEDVVRDVIRQLTPLSRAEPGCRLYQAYADPDQPRVFHLLEVYDDEDAYKAHGESEHFQRLGFGTAIPLLERREREFYVTLTE